MADTKISALPASTTPLAGTEIVPLVQGGTTKNVSVANLTAGRSVSASALSTTAGMVDVRATSGIGVRFIETSSGNTNRIQLGTGSGFGYIDATAGTGSTYLSLQAASVEYAKLETSGNLILNTGNLVPGTAAKGINFTANTPAAGMTSQLLNWYEEGTWTPSVSASSGSITTVGTVVGRYTRIGRVVTLYAALPITNNGTGAGALLVTGMPFTASSDISLYPLTGYNGSTAKTIGGALQASNSTMYLRYYDGTYPVNTAETVFMQISYQT